MVERFLSKAWALCSNTFRSVAGLFVRDWVLSKRSSICKTCALPVLAGNRASIFADAPVNSIAPTRLPRRVIKRAKTPVKLLARFFLVCSAEPKLRERERSIKNQVVISRSS